MKLTKIKLHGHFGEAVNKNEWELYVSSTQEALRAIDALSGRKLFKHLIESQKRKEKCHVLINGRNFTSEKEIKGFESKEDIENIKNSELCFCSQKIETIDIIPAIEGAKDFIAFFTIIVGVLLIAFSGGNPALIMAGIGLIAAGITTLLMAPPEFEEVRKIEGAQSSSFLFRGPEQSSREGGPVPIGYGEMLVGSQVISTAYFARDIDAALGQTTS